MGFFRLGLVWAGFTKPRAHGIFSLLWFCIEQPILAGVAELADALDSKSSDGHPSWGFKSPLRHQSHSSFNLL